MKVEVSMRPIDVLETEHRWIRHMLQGLEHVIRHVRTNHRFDGAAAFELLGLFESFADGSHQEKEERHLFPRLLTRADPHETNKIRGLLGEHADERRRMLQLRSSLTSAYYGDESALREFVRVATSYVALHKEHMAAEHAVVFPMAERLLTADDEREVLTGFESSNGGSRQSPVVFERIADVCQELGMEVPEAAEVEEQ